jgi:uncharacterized OsmC-like protein
MSGEDVIVRDAGPGTFQTEAIAGPHRWLADEPGALGGTATGPSPYDMLLAALGSCTVMTLRVYAERKEWPLRHVSVTLRHHKIHAEDCAECETKKGMIDRIDREITIEGDLDAEQRARLLQIADMCPVHRTLHSEIQVVTSLLP